MARVLGWLLSDNLRTGPGRRVLIGSLIRDGQPRSFPLETPSLGLAVLIEGEPGPHEVGFCLSLGEREIASPLIVTAELPSRRGWLFLDRGPNVLPEPGTYVLDISIDGEMAESAEIRLEKLVPPKTAWKKKKT